MKRCLQCQTTFNSSRWNCPQCGYVPESAECYPIFAPELLRDNDAYAPDFFANLAQLEEGHFWFEARNELLLWVIQKYCLDIKKILEIGCGTGFVLRKLQSHFREAELYGSDLLIEGLYFASQRVSTATLVQMDARDIPYQQEFDLICALDVIEHIEEDELALSQMYNAVRPGGKIIITVPQHMFLWSTVDELSYHKRRYGRDDLINKVRKAGFEVIKTASFVSLLLPLMLFNRSRKSKEHKEFDLYSEFKINRVLNAILSKIMMLEIAFIRHGIPFRLGGSRLLVVMRPE